ncbi:RNHCP domain-containing protein [Streptomyces buecherae]|uniref:RNHCP domain-containing protein n=1 Tax=Streptomyces buecherae TaxID=2763006 RepID=UPI00164D4594|nr:RNHCP domain-containing protein [Streptomyces buecherae]MBC3988123.1 RNHCP domain-containing protein [Streptomyces buecherae]QNJ43341.1 RNHCP domain-containing protein [Streptomyces buecherae]
MTRPSKRERAAHGRSRNATSFRCLHCGLDISLSAVGTSHRNHCPHCLWSRHLDTTPGDRAADCGARMEPLAITVRGDGEWVIIHRCTGCGVLHANRTAGDDNALPLTRLAVRPLAQPPFPFERLAGL